MSIYLNDPSSWLSQQCQQSIAWMMDMQACVLSSLDGALLLMRREIQRIGFDTTEGIPDATSNSISRLNQV